MKMLKMIIVKELEGGTQGEGNTMTALTRTLAKEVEVETLS